MFNCRMVAREKKKKKKRQRTSGNDDDNSSSNMNNTKKQLIISFDGVTIYYANTLLWGLRSEWAASTSCPIAIRI